MFSRSASSTELCPSIAMPEGTSIINFGELAKPATVLIEKISDALGGVFKPFQVKRVANAQAEAALIHAESEIKITELHRRAMRRFIEEEAKKQENIESITERAIPQLEDKAQPQKMDGDWISNFIGSLDKEDAILFSKLCGFGWMIGQVIPLIYDVQHEVYGAQGINFGSLTHLDSIGLINFNNLSGFQRLRLPKTITVHYYGNPLLIEFPKDNDNSLDLGRALLTQTGHQLAPICGSQPVNGFFDYVVERWAGQAYAVASPYPRDLAGV